MLIQQKKNFTEKKNNFLCIIFIFNIINDHFAVINTRIATNSFLNFVFGVMLEFNKLTTILDMQTRNCNCETEPASAAMVTNGPQLNRTRFNHHLTTSNRRTRFPLPHSSEELCRTDGRTYHYVQI